MVKGPSNARFEAIFSQGRRVSGPSLKVASLYPGTGLVGIATAKKIGAKPLRNRVKRRIREAVRPVERDPRVDFVVIASVRTSNAAFGVLSEEVNRLLQEAQARWAEELASS